jgi:hypothetical protein
MREKIRENKRCEMKEEERIEGRKNKGKMI